MASENFFKANSKPPFLVYPFTGENAITKLLGQVVCHSEITKAWAATLAANIKVQNTSEVETHEVVDVTFNTV